MGKEEREVNEDEYIEDNNTENSKSCNYISYCPELVELGKYIRHRLDKITQNNEHMKAVYPTGLSSLEHTVLAGWDVGYHQGQVALIEEINDKLNDVIRKYGCD